MTTRRRDSSTLISRLSKQYDTDAIADQLVAIYDKHYTEEEIKACFSSSAHLLDRKSPQKCRRFLKKCSFNSQRVRSGGSRAWQEFHAQNSDSQAKQTPLLDVGAGNKARIPMVRTQQAQADPQQPDPAYLDSLVCEFY